MNIFGKINGLDLRVVRKAKRRQGSIGSSFVCCRKVKEQRSSEIAMCPALNVQWSSQSIAAMLNVMSTAKKLQLRFWFAMTEPQIPMILYAVRLRYFVKKKQQNAPRSQLKGQKFQIQNLDLALTSKPQPNVSILKLRILTKASFRILT